MNKKCYIVFATDNGFVSAVRSFDHFQLTIQDIYESADWVKRELGLTQTPVVINWLPMDDEEIDQYTKE